MGIKVKREYLVQIRERYRISTRQQKGKILDEFCHICDYSRKHAMTTTRSLWIDLNYSVTHFDQPRRFKL